MTVRDPHVMTLAEAARVSGKSVDTIRRWIAKGAVKIQRTPGRHVYVDVREVLPQPSPEASKGMRT